ncbi:MAG: hypothetical protein EZS28_032863, partial [Streblomastix strix]
CVDGDGHLAWTNDSNQHGRMMKMIDFCFDGDSHLAWTNDVIFIRKIIASKSFIHYLSNPNTVYWIYNGPDPRKQCKFAGKSQSPGPSDSQGNLLNQRNTSESTQNNTVGSRKKEQKVNPQLSPDDAWLKSFTVQNGNPDVEEFKDHCIELRNEVISHYYGKPMGKLDATGERASEEVRKELRGQSKDVQSIVGETKQVPILAGSDDLALEREDQLQAIRIQRMAKAGT